MRLYNKEKGITLIALVITIIVLLILAGISIAMLTGDNGILTKANNAKTNTASSTAKEKVQVAVMGSYDNRGKLNITELSSNVEKVEGLDKTKTTFPFEDLPQTVIVDGYEVTIALDGTVTVKGDGSIVSPNPPKLTLTQTSETKPYLIDDKSEVLSNNINEGIVVKDSKENEWVWIEVPRTATVYPTAGLEITAFTDEEYTKIENDLKTYTNDYRNGTAYKDEHYSEEQHGFTKEQYDNHKKGMLKSVYQNGGFYIGRYEVGATSYVSSDDNGARTPIIKQDAFPYNYVTCKKAQELSTGFATEEGRTSSLMFGVQWDLVLKYIEERGTKLGTTKDERKSKMIKTNYDLVSSDWGNYNNIGFTITRGQYSTDYGATYNLVDEEEGYPKPSGTNVLLTTGATNRNSVLNIYDLAGNELEWTLEYTASTDGPCAGRGGHSISYGSSFPASYRVNSTTSYSNYHFGFRPALW